MFPIRVPTQSSVGKLSWSEALQLLQLNRVMLLFHQAEHLFYHPAKVIVCHRVKARLGGLYSRGWRWQAQKVTPLFHCPAIRCPKSCPTHFLSPSSVHTHSVILLKVVQSVQQNAYLSTKKKILHSQVAYRKKKKKKTSENQTNDLAELARNLWGNVPREVIAIHSITQEHKSCFAVSFSVAFSSRARRSVHV